jgi:hypothetical protein
MFAIQRTNIQFLASLPVDHRGTVRLPKMPERQLVKDFLAHKKITDDLLCEHMLSMIQTMFVGIATKDSTAIHKVCEATFAQKLVESSEKVTFSYEPPGDAAIDNVYIVDKLFIKGVNADRTKNDSNADYVALKG